MVNIIFNNPYYSTGIAIVLSVLLAFAHKIEQWRSRIVLIILIVLAALLLINIHEDFGLVLLIVALIAVVFTCTLISEKRKKKDE